MCLLVRLTRILLGMPDLRLHPQGKPVDSIHWLSSCRTGYLHHKLCNKISRWPRYVNRRDIRARLCSLLYINRANSFTILQRKGMFHKLVEDAGLIDCQRGLATGITFSSGGIGATCLTLAMNALRQRIGLEWALRVIGLLTLGCCLPASYFLKPRFSGREAGRLNFTLFRNPQFLLLFFGGFFGMFVSRYLRSSQCI